MKVLKFGAKWCPECKIMKPRWAEIEKENPWLETEYYDFDENKEELDRWDIKEIPTFIFLDNQGKEFLRLYGEVSKEKLVDILNDNRDR